MITVDNGYITKQFECIAEMMYFFGHEEGLAILDGTHSQYSITYGVFDEYE